MRSTIDTFTGKRFNWNDTVRFVGPDGTSTIVPARYSTRTATFLHPSRVPARLLAELNAAPSPWRPIYATESDSDE